MNKFFLLICLIFSLSVGSSCNKSKKEAIQETKTYENKTSTTETTRAKKLDFTEELGLSPKQEVQFEDIREKFTLAMNEIRNDDEMDRDILKNRIKKLKTDQLSEVEQILDESQFKKYKSLISRRSR